LAAAVCADIAGGAKWRPLSSSSISKACMRRRNRAAVLAIVVVMGAGRALAQAAAQDPLIGDLQRQPDALRLQLARYRAGTLAQGQVRRARRVQRRHDLLRRLLSRFKPVSYERVLSGPGLQNNYQYLRDTSGEHEPAWLTDWRREQGTAAAISSAGLDDTSELCVEALDMFVSMVFSQCASHDKSLAKVGAAELRLIALSPRRCRPVRDVCRTRIASPTTPGPRTATRPAN